MHTYVCSDVALVIVRTYLVSSIEKGKIFSVAFYLLRKKSLISSKYSPSIDNSKYEKGKFLVDLIKKGEF